MGDPSTAHFHVNSSYFSKRYWSRLGPISWMCMTVDFSNKFSLRVSMPLLQCQFGEFGCDDRGNDSWVIMNFSLVLYTRSFCGYCREKVDIDRRHGQCPANGRDLLHSLRLCIDLCFFNDFFCVAKHIKRISINVAKHLVIRSFISYSVKATSGSVRPSVWTISDSVLALLGRGLWNF